MAESVQADLNEARLDKLSAYLTASDSEPVGKSEDEDEKSAASRSLFKANEGWLQGFESVDKTAPYLTIAMSRILEVTRNRHDKQYICVDYVVDGEQKQLFLQFENTRTADEWENMICLWSGLRPSAERRPAKKRSSERWSVEPRHEGVSLTMHRLHQRRMIRSAISGFGGFKDSDTDEAEKEGHEDESDDDQEDECQKVYLEDTSDESEEYYTAASQPCSLESVQDLPLPPTSAQTIVKKKLMMEQDLESITVIFQKDHLASMDLKFAMYDNCLYVAGWKKRACDLYYGDRILEIDDQKQGSVESAMNCFSGSSKQEVKFLIQRFPHGTLVYMDISSRSDLGMVLQGNEITYMNPEKTLRQNCDSFHTWTSTGRCTRSITAINGVLVPLGSTKEEVEHTIDARLSEMLSELDSNKLIFQLHPTSFVKALAVKHPGTESEGKEAEMDFLKEQQSSVVRSNEHLETTAGGGLKVHGITRSSFKVTSQNDVFLEDVFTHMLHVNPYAEELEIDVPSLRTPSVSKHQLSEVQPPIKLLTMINKLEINSHRHVHNVNEIIRTVKRECPSLTTLGIRSEYVDFGHNLESSQHDHPLLDLKFTTLVLLYDIRQFVKETTSLCPGLRHLLVKSHYIPTSHLQYHDDDLPLAKKLETLTIALSTTNLPGVGRLLQNLSCTCPHLKELVLEAPVVSFCSIDYTAPHNIYHDLTQLTISASERMLMSEEDFRGLLRTFCAHLTDIKVKRSVAMRTQSMSATRVCDNVERITSMKTGKSVKGNIDDRGGTLSILNYGFSLFVPAGAIEPGSNTEISLEVLPEMETDLDLQNQEMLVSFGFRCTPSGLIFKKPLELTLPHCAIITDPKVATVLHTGPDNNDGDCKFSRISLNPEDCVFQLDKAILQLKHFSRGYLTIFYDWLFTKGKRMACTPFLPTTVHEDEESVILHVRLYDDLPENEQIITLEEEKLNYRKVGTEMQVFAGASGSSLELTCRIPNLSYEQTKEISCQSLMQFQRHNVCFEVTKAVSHQTINLEIDREAKQELLFKADFELEERVIHEDALVPYSSGDGEGSTASALIQVLEYNPRIPMTFPPRNTDRSDPMSGSIAHIRDIRMASDRIEQGSQDVMTDEDLVNLSHRLPFRNFRTLAVKLNFDMVELTNIQHESKGGQDAYCTMLHLWKMRTGGDCQQLKDVLDECKLGGIALR